MPIPSGVTHRWRAGAVTGNTDGGKLTVSVPNEGSSTLTLSQGTDSLRPIWKSSSANLGNKAVFVYDGVDDLLVCANYTTPGTSTIVLVAWIDPAKTTAGQPFYSNSQEMFWTLNDKHGLWRPNGTVHVAGNPTRDAQVWTGVYDISGNTSSFIKNGTVAASSTTTSNNGASAHTAGIGNHPNTTLNRSWPGEIAEILIWQSKILTSSELADIHTYVQDTYGITVADYKVHGSISGSTPKITGSFSGQIGEPVDGSISATTPKITGSLSASITVSGSVSSTLSPVSASLTAEAEISGSLAGSIGAVQGSASGTVTVSGSMAGSVPALVGSSSGTVTVSGSLNGSLTPVSVSLAAEAQVSGSLTGSIAPVSGSASGTVTVSASMSGIVPAVTGSITGGIAGTGSISASIPTLTATWSGQVQLSGGEAADSTATALPEPKATASSSPVAKATAIPSLVARATTTSSPAAKATVKRV